MWFCYYFGSIFVPRNCSFKSLLLFSENLMLFFIDKVNIKFSALYLIFCINRFCCCWGWTWSRWICSWIIISGGLDILNIIQIKIPKYQNTISNKALFHSWLKANQEIDKHYSNILMIQQFLSLMCYYQLACFPLTLTHSRTIYLLLSCCYLFSVIYFYRHLPDLYNNSTNFPK